MKSGEAKPRSRGLKRRRRREIEERFQRAGFRASGLAEEPPWPDPRREERVLRLRSELGSLGPAFLRLGRYLSTRIDLLPAEDCRALAALPDAAPEMGQTEVLEFLRSELPGVTFARVDFPPLDSALSSQTHRAVLFGGEEVTLRLVRSSWVDGPDLEVLPGLASWLSNVGWPLGSVVRLLEDFRRLAEREMDLTRTASTLHALGRLSAEGRAFGAPRVLQDLSTPRLLTVERAPLSEWTCFPGADPDPAARAHIRSLGDLFVRLCFECNRIPEELSAEDLGVSAGGSLQLTGGVFFSLAADESLELWKYLLASARDDPGGVHQGLVALSTPREGARADELRRQLDHLVPRRDGRFGEVPPGLPELLFAHWREMQRHGLEPSPGLLAFYRGLVRLREIAGGGLSHDVFREALQAAQVSRAAASIREALGEDRRLRGAETLLDALREFLTRLLGVRAGKTALPKTEGDERGDSWAPLLAGLLATATLVLWFERLPTLLGRFTPAIEAVTVALLGLVLLRAAWRSGA